MSDFTCETCGAFVTDDVHLPPDMIPHEIESWWDMNSRHWCPVHGEFRKILQRGEKPCK